MTSAVEPLRNEDGTVFQLPATPAHLEYMTAIPVCRQAARDAVIAMEHNANGHSLGVWYVWYLSLEIGEQLFATKFKWVQTPRDDLVRTMTDIPDNFPFDPQNGVVRASHCRHG